MSRQGLSWIKFYPDDWVGDGALARCSLESQGCFARLIAVLHRSSTYGYLPQELSFNDIAKLVSIHPRTFRKCMDELLKNGVLKQDEKGIYNKRMVLDQQKRERGKHYGRLGGNPKLVAGVAKGVNPQGYPSKLTPILNPLPYPSGLTPTLNPELELELEEEVVGKERMVINPYVIPSTVTVEDPTAAPPSTPRPEEPEEPTASTTSSGLVDGWGRPAEDPEPLPPEIIECVQREWGLSYWNPGMELWVRGWLRRGATPTQIMYAVQEAAARGHRNRAYAGKIIERLLEEGGDPLKLVDIYGPDGQAIIERWDAETWRRRCHELDVGFYRETGRWRIRPGGEGYAS